MDRTLISFTPENIITVNLMVFFVFLILALVFQFVVPMFGGSETANNSGGY